MHSVVFLVLCAVIIGLPNFLYACQEKSTNSKREKGNFCSVPKIKNGGIRIEKIVQMFDWYRFRTVNSKVYEKVKPGSTPPFGSRFFIFCNTGYSFKGEGKNSIPTFCKKGTWKPNPICLKSGVCMDPPKPSGTSIKYLSPTKSKSFILESEFSLLGENKVPLSKVVITSTPSKELKKSAVSQGSHLLRTTAVYSCKSKYYELVGSKFRRCLLNGNWSGSTPTCVPKCGRSSSPQAPLISYGDATDIGQWPWQAKLAEYFPKENKWYFKCGGSLINESWIITAAHCITYDKSAKGLPPEELKVYLGKYHRNDTKDDKYVQVKEVSKVQVHPNYNHTEFDADIALLQLSSPVTINSRVQPVCLPTEETSRWNLVEGRKGVVTGWGRNENKTLSDTLQQAVLPVVSRAKCIKGFENAGLSLIVTKNMFCAGYDSGKTDTCGGDSGGPAVFKAPSFKGNKWVLEGIVSWGSPHGCGRPNQYGVYTTVSKFLDWIHSYL